MLTPTVSICLPNLNNRRYLEERLETIRVQTLMDWELIISDNYSDDGAWQLLSAAAAADQRMRAFQTPRGGGMYPNWNVCIREAKGEFVYVATSDDTMAPDCLKQLVEALRSHPECDLAHCPLKAIDADGREVSLGWYNTQPFVVSSGEMLNRRHVRRAPFDGMLHLTGKNVYMSITQLLIRRSVFDRIGLFESQWGSMGDFEWEMKASLLCNTIHVPETWGGWRLHPEQATATIPPPLEHRTRAEEMIDHAINRVSDQLTEEVRRCLRSWRRKYLYERAEWWLREDRSALGRIGWHLRGLASGKRSEWDSLGRLFGMRTRAGVSDCELIQQWCAECGVEQPLQWVQG